MTRDYMLQAVREDGLFLKNADEKLAADKEIVIEAVRQNGEALKFAHMQLREDKAFFMNVLKECSKGCAVLQYASPRLWGDKEVVQEAVKVYGMNLEYAASHLRGDREIVLEAVKNCGLALAYASEALHDDPSIISAAIQADEGALEFAAFQEREQGEALDTGAAVPSFKAATWAKLKALMSSDVSDFGDVKFDEE